MVTPMQASKLTKIIIVRNRDLNGGAVSWKSSKQETVVDSTTEAEYIAASEAAKEGVWIKKFISKLGVVPNVSSPLDLQGLTRNPNTYSGVIISFER